MTNLKRAAEAVTNAGVHHHYLENCPACKKLKRAVAALRAALQREDQPISNAVESLASAIVDSRISETIFPAQWESWAVEILTEIRERRQREEPKVEVPSSLKLPLSFNDKEEYIYTNDNRVLAWVPSNRVDDGKALIALANRAATQEAGRELAKMVISGASIDRQEKWVRWEVMKAKAREVLGKKDGE